MLREYDTRDSYDNGDQLNSSESMILLDHLVQDHNAQVL